MFYEKHELSTLCEHMGSPLVFGEVRVAHRFSFLCSVVFYVLFVFVLCLVCPMLPVVLDCLRPVSCVSNVASGSGLSSSCVLCVQCCQWFWIVFVLCPVYPMLSVSLDCLRPVSCVSNVVSGSGLSIRFSLTFIEDNKCVIRSRKLNDIQNHCQHKKDKMTKYYTENEHHSWRYDNVSQ
jgi:hypothetical protein